MGSPFWVRALAWLRAPGPSYGACGSVGRGTAGTGTGGALAQRRPPRRSRRHRRRSGLGGSDGTVTGTERERRTDTWAPTCGSAICGSGTLEGASRHLGHGDGLASARGPRPARARMLGSCHRRGRGAVPSPPAGVSPAGRRVGAARPTLARRAVPLHGARRRLCGAGAAAGSASGSRSRRCAPCGCVADAGLRDRDGDARARNGEHGRAERAGRTRCQARELHAREEPGQPARHRRQEDRAGGSRRSGGSSCLPQRAAARNRSIWIEPTVEPASSAISA
jgi:hypothetical protein